MLKTPHQNGPCTVQYGSICGLDGYEIESPAIILCVPNETDDIVLLRKYGPVSKIAETYEKMRQKFISMDCRDDADELVLITFNAVSGFADYDKVSGAKLTPDEICTIINWLSNQISVAQYKDLMQKDEASLHEKIKKLYDFGF